ncbi:MAG: carboxyltransferase domain-containing protein [Paracoccaceae bacterium]
MSGSVHQLSTRTRRGFPRISTMGLSGVLVTFADELSETANRAALAFRDRVEADRWEGIEETAVSLSSAFLRFDPLCVAQKEITVRLSRLLDSEDWYAAALPSGRRRWRIPTVFGGPQAPQFDEVAELAGLSSDKAVAELTARPVRVMTIGFAPGLPYMGILPAHWDIPRQTALTPLVPASAVVLAVRQLIIFSTPTPTGWRHIGQTCFRGFRPETETPFVLRSGDEVSLVSVSAEKLNRLKADPKTNGGATCEPIP